MYILWRSLVSTANIIHTCDCFNYIDLLKDTIIILEIWMTKNPGFYRLFFIIIYDQCAARVA